MLLQAFRYLLFPFSLLFAGLVRLRNFCYQKKWLKSQSYNFPIILVGNVHVGGTGKTPMVAYILNLLQQQYKTAMLSRGYGRTTKGYIEANNSVTAQSIGDEPLQLYQNFGDKVLITVCEDRNKGVQMLMPQCETIVMDDAFQHRSILAGYQIVLIPFETFFSPQFLLPTGNLREPLAAHNRAQMIIVSKCPAFISQTQKIHIQKKIHPKLLANTYYSTLKYQHLKSLFSTECITPDDLKNYDCIFLLTGIAHTDNLVNFLLTKNPNIVHSTFKDHHNFKRKEIQQFITDFTKHPTQKKLIVTTEKDAQRLKNKEFENLLLNLPLFYLPIEIEFLENSAEDFKQKIINYVKTYSRDRTIHTTKNTAI